MQEKRHISRFIIFSIVISLILILIIWRYLSLMIITPTQNSARGLRSPRIERGPILDRNGRILAMETQLDSITAWMPYVRDPEATAEALISVLDVNENAVRDRFRTGRGFFYIKRSVPRHESEAVRALLSEGQISGINLVPEHKRVYPHGSLASHVIGLSGQDNQGLMGIEYSMDRYLYPQISPANPTSEYGNRVYLSIDIHIQYMLEEIAKKAYQEHNPDYVTLIAADAVNGEILAYVNIPSFNSNTFNDSSPESRINHPAVSAYEPGSVFKIYSIAGIMEHGEISPSSLFYCGGSYDHVHPAISCLRAHGWVTPADIISVSCNTGAAYAAEKISQQDFYRLLNAFGFGSRTSLPLPGETNGILNPLTHWSTRSKPTIAFGQEISVSALQLVQAATVFANQGDLIELRLVNRIESSEGEIIELYNRKPLRRVLSSNTARAMLLSMETATKSSGTGTQAVVNGIRMSAKTGTAQVPDSATGRYSTTNYVASTLALFPTENPRIILYAAVHHPRGPLTYGSRIAAPMIAEAANEIIRYLGIQRDGDVVLDHSGIINVPAHRAIVVDNTMPNLLGLSKRQILPVLTGDRFKTSIYGSGWVINQEPDPGTILEEGSEIRIWLE